MAGRLAKCYYLAGLLTIYLATYIKGNTDVLESFDQTGMRQRRGAESDCPVPNSPMNFESFNNLTKCFSLPSGCFIVPNTLHIVRINEEPVSYIHMICYLAAFQQQKPEKIFIHFNDKATFTGKYWDILKAYPGFMDVVEMVQMDMQNEIHGLNLNDVKNQVHLRTIAGVKALINHGGVYMDNDLYMTRSMRCFLRYEMTVGWDTVKNVIGTSLLIAHKDARLLKMWIDYYQATFLTDSAKYNPEDYLSKILIDKPYLAHVEKYFFGMEERIQLLFAGYWDDWKKFYYSLDTKERNRIEVLGPNKVKELNMPAKYDEINIINAKNTMRNMALTVYNPTNVTI